MLRVLEITDGVEVDQVHHPMPSHVTGASDPNQALRRSVRIAERSSPQEQRTTPRNSETATPVSDAQSNIPESSNSDPINRELTLALEVEDRSSNRDYIMNVIVQPPSEARPGSVLEPPIVVRLEDQRTPSPGRFKDGDEANLWAMASVVSEDGMVALAPPQPNLISGTLVDSLHQASTPRQSPEVGFLTFRDLTIHRNGNYRIRISLIRMPSVQDSAQAASAGAINLQSAITRVIRVTSTATKQLPSKSSFHILTAKH